MTFAFTLHHKNSYKKVTTMQSLIETRDRHFLNVCRKIIRDHYPAKLTLREVAERAVMSPAPHYYCTFEYALRMLRVMRHGRLKLRNDRRLEMWKEINTKVEKLMRRQGYSLIDALSNVLAGEPASRFFITPDTAFRLLYRAKCEDFVLQP